MGSGISDFIGSIGAIKNAVHGRWPGDKAQPTDINPAPTGAPGVAGVPPTGNSDSDIMADAKTKAQSPLVEGLAGGVASGLSAWDDAKARIAAGGRGAAPIAIPQGSGQIVQPNLSYLNPQQQYAPPSAFYGR